MDLDIGLFWEGLTQGQNWLLTTLVLLLTWFGGRFQAVAGRRTEGFIERRWEGAIAAFKSNREARKVRKVQKVAAERLDRIRRERVGRKFIRRSNPEDPGMLGEVVDLARDRPGEVVIVLWSNPPGRVSHDRDYEDGARLGIEWRHLTASPAQQKHYTARMLERSSDDADGWVEFEESNS